MKAAYPIVLTPAGSGYVVTVPDLQINTEGADIADAIDMAADAIGLWGITAQDMGKEIPAPSPSFPECAVGEITAFALVDFDAYRRGSSSKGSCPMNLAYPAFFYPYKQK